MAHMHGDNLEASNANPEPVQMGQGGGPRPDRGFVGRSGLISPWSRKGPVASMQPDVLRLTNPRSGQVAFTLIELLVVMGIMGILFGLLMPALGRARQQARTVQCLNNIKQWGQAIWLYAEDHDEEFPYEGHFLTPIDKGVNLDAWYNSVPAHLGLPTLTALYQRDDPPLPGDYSPWVCPSVSRTVATRPKLSAPYFMYGFNNRLDPNGPRQFHRFQVRQPGQTAVFTENSEKRYPATSGRHTAPRHAFRANLAFVDGHARPVGSNDFFRTAAEDNDSEVEWAKPRDVYWYPYPGAPP